MRRAIMTLLLLVVLPLLGGDCSGDGGGGDRLILRVEEIDPRCVPLVGAFPPGFDFMPGGRGHAVAVQTTPPSVVFLDLDHEPPRLLAEEAIYPIPFDSDGDGLDDVDARLCESDTFEKSPVLGAPLAVDPGLVFVPASGYEEVIFATPPDGVLTPLRVTTPTSGGRFFAEDYPYLPPEGESAERTALSTKACIYLTPDAPVDPIDSTGRAIGTHACCDRVPDVPSFVTRFTAVAGIALGADRLFVATSNLYRASQARFFPGTVLVYDFDRSSAPHGLSPSPETPYVFTTGFNPTALTPHRTANGRDLVLVTVTGAIGAGVGAENIKTEGAIDVIDAASGRLVATVPLGLAGGSFYPLAIDASGRVGVTGSTSLRQLYAIDLSVLDDESLYLEAGVVRLDGSDPDHPDARIHDAASPFVIPARPDGPPPEVCAGWTQAAVNQAGNLVFATDYCDGTLSILDLEVPTRACAPEGPAEGECCDAVPLPQACLRLQRMEELLAPSTAATELRQPAQLATRPGTPGSDYTGPDLYFIASVPEGQLCGVRVESFKPSP